MTKPARPVRFLFTRVATAGSAVAAFVSLWAGVAATAPGPESDNGGEEPAVAEVVEQDGWRWDPAANEWVAIEPQPQPTAEAAPQEQVVIIERQPVVYQYHYVYEPAGGSPAAGSSGARATGSAGGPAAASGAPPSSPAEAPSTAEVVEDQPTLYVPPVSQEPALPPPAPAAAPTVAPAPAAPPPKPAPTSAPKSTKGS